MALASGREEPHKPRDAGQPSQIAQLQAFDYRENYTGIQTAVTDWSDNGQAHTQINLPQTTGDSVLTFPYKDDQHVVRDEEVVHAPTQDKDRHNHWHSALACFFREAGLTQTSRGFESDMLLLNEEWEKGKVRDAVQRLFLNLAVSV